MQKPIISIIAALSDNRVIGKDNRVPWRIPADLHRLKSLTLGKTVILGRKSYDSMLGYYSKSGREMPGKTYIVVTTNKEYTASREQDVVVHSIDEAIGKASGESEVFAIGGQQIFEQILPSADKLYLTVVHTSVDGDAYFPGYADFKKIVFQEDRESDGYCYTFFTLEKE
jgi:dihydrofolate reductase